MAKQPKQYVIENISDVLKIPEDRFDAFLVDFVNFYKKGKEATDEVVSSSALARLLGYRSFARLTWIDDGKNDATIRIRTNI